MRGVFEFQRCLDGSGIEAEDHPCYQTSRIVRVPPDECVQEALGRTAQGRALASSLITDRALVGARLNLNILRATGVCVNSVHSGAKGDGYKRNKGLWRQKVIALLPVVQLKHAYCNVHQSARAKIATGAINKQPCASVDGNIVLDQPYRFDGVELCFNPHRESLFLDPLGLAVHSVEHATVCGHRVYARGRMTYYRRSEAPTPPLGHDHSALFIDDITPVSINPHAKHLA